RLFGANVHPTAHPYPKCRIWAPWNLTMAAHSCLANNVDCYNVAPVMLEEYAIVSQYSYLCSASHDFNDAAFPPFTRMSIRGRSLGETRHEPSDGGLCNESSGERFHHDA